MAVAAPSANPSGGLAFGYTFTLTDNFTAAAEKIALSFQTIEKAAITSAARVSANISRIVGSAKGLDIVTVQVNRLASAFERLSKAKKSAGVSSSIESIKNSSISKTEAQEKAAQNAREVAARKQERARIAENKAYENQFEKELRKEQKKIREQEAADKARAVMQRKEERGKIASEKEYERGYQKELQKELQKTKELQKQEKLNAVIAQKQQKELESSIKAQEKAAEKVRKTTEREFKRQESEQKGIEYAKGVAARKLEREQSAEIKRQDAILRKEERGAEMAAKKAKKELEAQQRISRSSTKVGALDSHGERVEGHLGSVMQGLGTMFLGASLFKPLLYSIKVSDEFERAQIRLKGLLGSDIAAKNVLKDVKMDAKNDFLLNSKDLLMSNASLISQGASSDFARKLSNDVSTLAQVGGGSVEGFGNAIKGISRILGSGKINARQVGRLETGGANIAIAKYSKEFLNKSLFDSSGRVNISADEFYKMIAMAAEKYRPIAEEMRNTVTGLESMVSEGTTYIMAEFGKINSVIYKQLLKGLDAFMTKLMIFTQTPIGNVVIKLLSAALTITALTVTLMGLRQILIAVANALSPIMGGFIKMAVIGMLVYKMLQSNSSAFVALGIAISLAMGGAMPMVAVVNLLWRAWQTFNDVTEQSYQKLSPLNQMFARWGGYLEAFGEILSTINGDTYLLSESLVMKLKSIGAFDTVLSIGDALLKIYRGLKWIYEIGKSFVGFFNGWKGWAVVVVMSVVKMFQLIFAFARFGELLMATKVTSVLLTNTWALLTAGFKIASVALSEFFTIAASGTASAFFATIAGAVLIVGTLAYAFYNLFESFKEGVMSSQQLWGNFLLDLMKPFTWLSESMFGKVAPEAPMEGSKDGSVIDPTNMGADFGFIPSTFDSDMSTQRQLSSMRYQPQMSNRDAIGSIDNTPINVNVHYDGDLIYRDQVKRGSINNARNDYSHNS